MKNFQSYPSAKISMRSVSSVVRIFKMILSNVFSDSLSITLIAASILSMFFSTMNGDTHRNDFSEVAAIISLIIVNASVGAVQDHNSSKEKVKFLDAIKTSHKILRGSKLVKEYDLNLNDIIYLCAGDKVPGDTLLVSGFPGRVILPYSCGYLGVDEGILSGENLMVVKKGVDLETKHPTGMRVGSNSISNANGCSDKFFSDDSGDVLKSENTVFAESYVIKGSCYGIVKRIGEDTVVGEMEKIMNETLEGGGTMIKRVRAASNILFRSIGSLCSLLFLLSIPKIYYSADFRSEILQSLKCCISLAITAIPEGLDLSDKICLAFCARRLSKIGIYIKDPRKLEVMGDVDVICLDKTGTITFNKQKMEEILVMKSIGMEAIENDEKGKYFRDRVFSSLFAVCNEDITVDDIASGDALDIAMFNAWQEYKDVYEPPVEVVKTPFSFDKKGILCKVKFSDGKAYEIFKGAPECVLEMCKYVKIGNEILPMEGYREMIDVEMQKFSKSSHRIIAGAYKDLESGGSFTFLFFILFSDPPRDGVDRCIKKLRRNGINVVIVTGDSLETTRSVCEKIGFTEEEGNEERLHDPKTSSLDIITSNKVALSGKDLDKLTEDEKVNLVSKASIIYRAEPKHKLEVVKALKRANRQVLMVGDGVNDVLAMNYCDISASMGCGNDLCRDRCDLIITDDDFLKIIGGIEGGKESIHNMLCLLKYLISSNLGEVFCILLCYILNVRECLGSSHLLLVNVLTDGLPATFLCMSSGGCRARKSGLSRGLAIRTISIGLYSGLTTLLVYFHYLSYSTRGPRLEYKDIRNVNPHDQLTGTTLSLIFIICAEMMNSLNNISLYKSLLRVNIWKNNRYLTMSAISSIVLLFVISKYDVMRTIFNVGEVRPDEFFFLLILSFPVILIDEAFKMLLKD